MPSKSQSILLGAAIAVAFSMVQFFLVTSGGGSGAVQALQTLLCCLTAIGGAGVAVWHYTSENQLTIPAGTGAGIGAAASALGSSVSYVLGLLLQTLGVVPSNEEIMEQARENALRQNPELSAEQLDQIMGFAEGMQGIAGAAFQIVVIAIIGAIIGAVAASLFKKGGDADDLDPIA